MVHAEDLTLRLLPTTDETIETIVGKKTSITGSGRNFSLQGSFPQGRAKYRVCVGVFVSSLHKDTRVSSR